MATTYVLKAANSDLTGGADFTKEISAGTEAAGSITVSVAKSATEDSLGFTPANVPSTDGITGNYTAEVNVTTGSTDIQISVAVARVNSAGTQQSISSFTAEQTGSAGVKTFSLSSINLGTWASGDRLKVVYRFRNTNTMSARSVTIETGTTDAEVVSPWTILTPTRGQVSFAELEAPFVLTRGQVSFAELEAPLVLTRGQVSFAEFEAPTVLTRGQVSWAELEAPTLVTRGQVSWAVFEAPEESAVEEVKRCVGTRYAR